MTEVATPTNPAVTARRNDHSVLGQAHGELVIRILGTHRHGQVVRLATQKCTIGSAPASTLRILAPGVSQLHCVIVRGAGETVVRRWSPDTRLNGGSFTDANLHVGDRLGVGPIELEVVELHAGARFVRRPVANFSAKEKEELNSTIASLREEIADQSAKLAGSLASAQDERTDLEARLADRDSQIEQHRAEVARLESELSEATSTFDASRVKWEAREAKLLAELEAAQQANDSEAASVAAEQAELQSQNEQLTQDQQQLTVDREEVEAQLEELASAEQELADRRAALDAAEELAEAEIAQRREELATLEQELSAANDLTQTETADLDGQREQLRLREEQLDQLKQELEAKAAELEAATSDVAADLANREAEQTVHREEWEQQQATLDARQAELDAREAELDQREAALAEREELLQQQSIRLEEVATQLKEERDRWEAECEAAREEIEYSREQLVGDDAEAVAADEVNLLRRKLEAESARLAELQVERDGFAEEARELRHQAEQLQDSASDAAELEALRQQLDAREAELETAALRIQEKEQALEQSNDAWEHNHRDIDESEEDWQAASPELAAAAEEAAAPAEESDADQAEEAGAGDPADALERLRAQGLWNDDGVASEPAEDLGQYMGGGSDEMGSPEPAYSDYQADDYGAETFDESSTGDLGGLFPGGGGDDFAALDEVDVADTGEPESHDEPSPTNLFDEQPVAEPTFEQPAGAAPAPPSGDDDEVSIEDYMAQLLQRVGGSSEGASPMPAANRTTSKTETLTNVPGPQDVNETTTTNPPADEPPKEYVPRSAAPERQANLSAMRDLANQSSRTAIHTSAKSVKGRAASTKLVLAVVAGGFGVAMLMMVNSLVSLPTLGALGCFGAAGYLAYESLQLRSELKAARRAKQESQLRAAANPQPPASEE